MKDKTYPLKLDKEYKVVTANDLIRGRQKMTLREAQLLFIAISQVVKEDKDFKTYTTTVPELATFMGITEDSLYRDLKSICKELMQRTVDVQIGGKQWKLFHWISCAEYNNGTLTLRLSEDIKPYLIDLDRYYTTSILGTLMTFKSYYATRLYQVIWCDYRAQKESKEDWSYTCEELRELFQIKPKQYKQNRDLLKKTIKPAIEELNRSDYVMIWDYQEQKSHTRGSPLQGISFKAMFFEEKKDKEYWLANRERVEQINRLREEELLSGQLTLD